MTETMLAERREGLCERCDREYHANWAAYSPLWNMVVRGGCINGTERFQFLCANCFMELAEEQRVASRFHLDGEALVPLQTVTPSGRVWNPKSRLFERRKRDVTIEAKPKRRILKEGRPNDRR